MVHILHFAAAGCQNCGIGVEAGVAAQDRARDDGAHRQQRISANGETQWQDNGRHDCRNAPDTSGAEVQNSHQ